MSIELLNHAWNTNAPTLKKFVLISLADQANSDGICWPSLTYIERRTGMCRNSVISAIKWLEANGYVNKIQGVKKSNCYKINTSASGELVHQVNQTSAGNELVLVHQVNQTSASDEPKPKRTQTKPKKNPNKDKSIFSEKLAYFDLPEDLVEEWLDIRKKKKAVDSERAWNVFIAEVEKSGISIKRVLEKCCTSGSGWVSFKAEWIQDSKPVNQESEMSQIDRVAAKLEREMMSGHQNHKALI